MKLVDTTCPHCGSALKIDSSNKNATCEYCGAALLIDDEVQHVQYDNAEEAGYKFEKGRQRAQAEAKRNTTRINTQTYQQPPKKKRKTWLWVLGWICVFPLPLTILLLRKKDMKPALKYGIIAAAWIVYLLIGLSGGFGDSNKNTTEQSSTPAVVESTQTAAQNTEESEAPTETTQKEETETAETQAPAETMNEMTALQAFYDDFSANGNLDSLKDMVNQYGLYSDHRKDGIGHDTYKVAYTKELAKLISDADLATAGNYVVIKFNLLQNDNIDSITFHTDAADVKPTGDHYDENLNGRGRADSGRSEPDYINVIGYVALSASQAYDVEKLDTFQDESLWVVPTYEQDKQFWNENGTLPHKTEVVVREQMLKHEGYGSYSGYLLVEKTDDGSQYYINVNNFITKPYWTYQNDMRTSALTGDFVAEYKQVSDYYPVDSGGDKLEIPDGTIVLVTGVTDTSSKFYSSETSIEAIVWKEWRNGYGGVKCHFNADDLTIIY